MFKSIVLAASITAIGGLAIQPAMARALHGDDFVTTMNDNTLSGKDSRGDRFNVYFLPGGSVSYEVANQTSGVGIWKLDNAGDVCVTWAPPAKARWSGCYLVNVKGNSMTFSGKDNVEHRGGLLGEVEPLTVHKKPN